MLQNRYCRSAAESMPCFFSTACGDMAAVNIRCGERPSTRVQAYDRRRRGPETQICHAGLAHARSGSAARAEKKLRHQFLLLRPLRHACMARTAFYFEPRKKAPRWGRACWVDASLCKVAIRQFVTAGVNGDIELPLWDSPLARAPTLARSRPSAHPKS